MLPVITTGFVSLLFFTSGLQGESIKGIDKKIKTHQTELKNLKKQMQSVEKEKNELKQEENAVIKTLKKIESEMDHSSYMQRQLTRQVHKTEFEVQQIARELAFFSQEGNKWEQSMITDLQNYHVQFFYPQRLRKIAVKDRFKRSLISLKYGELRNVVGQKNFALQREKKLLNSKNNLKILKSNLEKEIQKQKESKLAKSLIYKTTRDKRIIAEQEAQRLKETSESLEALVSKLRKKREKSLVDQREADRLKKLFQEKRKKFPWPVNGTVISHFGKQQHPDLNIMVVNSGIKIKTEPNAAVKSIESGTVIYAADFRSYGQTVIIDHGGETYSVYGLMGNILVKEDEKVSAGKTLGTTTAEEGSQLYFEFRDQGHAENPLLWLQ